MVGAGAVEVEEGEGADVALVLLIEGEMTEVEEEGGAEGEIMTKEPMLGSTELGVQ